MNRKSVLAPRSFLFPPTSEVLLDTPLRPALKLQQVQMSHCLLIYLPSCACNLDTEQAFARSLASCVIYNHVSSFIKKSVSGAGASAETAAFHPLCAKQGSPSPGEACTEGRGVSGSASEYQA